MALTVRRIERLRKVRGRYRDSKGLYLQVTDASASWVFRFVLRGRERFMGLGPIDLVTLEEARDKAHVARKLLLAGVDPIEAKRTEAAAKIERISFEQAARQYLIQHRDKYRNPKVFRQFVAGFETFVFPIIGAIAVSDIDVGCVLRVLEQVHERYPGQTLWSAIPKTAAAMRGRIEAILDWATVRGMRSGDNPARWGGHLKSVLPSWRQLRKPVHHAALPFSEINQFIIDLRKRDGVAAKALEFTILTAARTGEVIGAVWDEINLLDRVWVIPAERMKGGKEHRVPLGPRAIAILKALPREEGNPFVFIGLISGKGLGHVALGSVLTRMGRGEITTHGFRSTFMDWAHETTASRRW
jgi:integrase